MIDVTIEEFLNAVYRTDCKDEDVCLALQGAKGFKHKPESEELLQSIQEAPDAWYVCASTVKKQTPMRRRKSDCVHAWCILLDDVGTKVEAPEVPPSIIMQTSEVDGKPNYQYLYLIEPLSLDADGVRYYEACHRSIVEAGWCDGGANGVNRVFRVPGSINLKEGRNNYATTIQHFEPESVYKLHQLMALFNLNPVYDAANPNFGKEAPLDGVEDKLLSWLYENDRILRKNDTGWYDIRCPWAHEHSTDDVKAGYSPLNEGDAPLLRGFQCFHEHCKHKSTIVFLAWVKEQGGSSYDVVGLREFEADRLRSLTSVLSYEEKVQYMRNALPATNKEFLPDCDRTPNGHPKTQQPTTRANVAYIVDTFNLKPAFNLMSRKVELEFRDPEMATLEIHHDDVRRTILDAATLLGVKSRVDIEDIMVELGRRYRYHPMEDWIKSKEWDGESRLKVLTDSVDVGELYADLWPAYIRKWLIQGVQAVCGWKHPKAVENVLVLAGPQMRGKTTWFNALVPDEYFTRSVHLSLQGYETSSRDSIIRATKTPLSELGELETTFKQADTGALKAFLSQTMDTYRKSHAKEHLDWPRVTSFCATVNRTDFLVDTTGSRRFWPVEITDKGCNAEHGLDAQQIWAEVYTWWKGGETWYLSGFQEKKREIASGNFRAMSEAEELAETYLEQHDDSNTRTMNVSDFCKTLMVLPNMYNRSSVRRVMEDRLGAMRKVGGVRNAWKVPTNPIGVEK